MPIKKFDFNVVDLDGLTNAFFDLETKSFLTCEADIRHIAEERQNGLQSGIPTRLGCVSSFAGSACALNIPLHGASTLNVLVTVAPGPLTGGPSWVFAIKECLVQRS